MPSTIVCTLVTRGEASELGQGSELLLFAPPGQRSNGQILSRSKLSFVQQEMLDGIAGDADKTKDASIESIKKNLLLDANKDMRLVRRSKRLPWTPGTYLETFVWRLNSSYERGFDYEYELSQAEEAHRAPKLPQDVDETQLQVDRACYRIVESRLGRWSHAWEGFHVFDEPASMPHEFVSTAYYSVILPRVLDEALVFASALQNLSIVDLGELGINCFLQLVRSRTGQQAFRHCWPSHVPPPGEETLELPDGVIKYRLTDLPSKRAVVAHHFRHVDTSHEPALSAIFLRILTPLEPLLLDTTTSLALFEKAALQAIAEEGARARFAMANIEKLAIQKLLEYASRAKRERLRIMAAGNDPLLFGVLRELVHFVTTISAHPYSSTNPHVHAMTHALEVEWASRPNTLQITLGEARPLCTGAVLAKRLYDVVVASGSRAAELRTFASSYSNPYFHPPLSPGQTSKLPSGLKQRVLTGLLGRGLAQTRSPKDQAGWEKTVETYGTLERLLRKAEAAVHGDEAPPNGLRGTRVRIEVAPDNALAGVLHREQKEDTIVVIAAEVVLSKTGDVVAAMGSWMLAEMAKKVGAKVFILAASDQILAFLSSTPPASPAHDPRELLAGWVNTLAYDLEDLDPFAEHLVDSGQANATVFGTASEVVPKALIDGYITEKGFLSAEGVAFLGKERALAEQNLYGESG
ncbi:hypothetical protein JCM1841_000443 [Sporobolomyces salmonicolor]